MLKVGLAYLAFTYCFVPHPPASPGWLTEARLLPIVQSTADVLLTVVPDKDFAYNAKQEVIRQAPPQLNQKADNQPAPSGHDPMAELIRKNRGGGAAKQARIGTESVQKPVQHKSAARR